jgi:DNA-binding IscR family transcriptional regulator
VDEEACRLRDVMLTVRDETAKVLDRISLSSKVPLGALED